MLDKYRKQVDEILSNRTRARERVKEERAAMIVAEDHLSRVNQAQNIVQHVAQSVQQQAHDKIATIVSRCLSTVFGDEAYTFKIVFERKRGKTEARLTFLREQHELDPRSGSGGGCIDVAAFALRLSALMLTRPALRRLLVLDEPFKNVHGEVYRERVRLMLETLSKEMGVQFVIVTGISEIQTGKVIELDG